MMDYMSADDFVQSITKTNYNKQSMKNYLHSLTVELKGLRALFSLISFPDFLGDSVTSTVPRVIDTAHIILNCENIVCCELLNEQLIVSECRLQKLIGKSIQAQGTEGTLTLYNTFFMLIVVIDGNIVETQDDFKNRLTEYLEAEIGGATRSIKFSQILIDGKVCGYVVARNKIPPNVDGINSSREISFNETDESLLDFISTTIGTSMRQNELLREQRKSKSFKILESNLNSLSTYLAGDVEIKKSLEHAYATLDADKLSLFAFNENTKMLECLISPDIQGLQLSPDAGIVGSSFKQASLINVADSKSDRRHYDNVDKKVGYETKSLLCVPIVDSEGKSMGCWEAVNKRSGPRFTAEDELILQKLTSTTGDIIKDHRQRAHKTMSGELLVEATMNLMSCRSFESLAKAVVDAVTSIEPRENVALYAFTTNSAGALCLKRISKGILSSPPSSPSSFTAASVTAEDEIPLADFPTYITDCIRTGRYWEAGLFAVAAGYFIRVQVVV